MTRKITLFVILVLVGAVASLDFYESCEERYEHVHPVVNFNITQFTGSWYLTQRYNNSLDGDRCNVSVHFNLHNDSSTDLNVVVSSAKQTDITGILQVNNSNTNNAKFSIKFTSEEYNFAVISTNYTSYSVAWLCKDLSNETSSQIVWVLSRNTALEGVKDAAEVNRTLTSNKLNHTLLLSDANTCISGSPTVVFNLFVLSFLVLIVYLIK